MSRERCVNDFIKEVKGQSGKSIDRFNGNLLIALTCRSYTARGDNNKYDCLEDMLDECITRNDVERSLEVILEDIEKADIRGDANAVNTLVAKFTSQVKAQIGKAVTQRNASQLITTVSQTFFNKADDVTYASVQDLLEDLITKRDTLQSLQGKLASIQKADAKNDDRTKDSLIDSFINDVKALIGRSISSADAGTLIAMVKQL
jgi:hypothetical protein